MKITESTVRQLEISEVPGLDPIRVMLSDLGPGQGRINIECWGKSWASYWGGMGKETIAEFFTTCDEHYIAKNLASGLESNIFDPDHLSDSLKQTIIKERKDGWLSKKEARVRFDQIEETDFPETIDGLWSMSRTMVELLGDEWWYSLPEKPNPDYEYLCRIIKAVQAALRKLAGKCYYAPDGTLMNPDGTRSIFDDVDQ